MPTPSSSVEQEAGMAGDPGELARMYRMPTVFGPSGGPSRTSSSMARKGASPVPLRPCCGRTSPIRSSLAARSSDFRRFAALPLHEFRGSEIVVSTGGGDLINQRILR
jgi:hypothetical protein